MSSIQIPNYEIPQPIGLSDMLEQSLKIKGDRQQQKMNDLKLQESQEQMNRQNQIRKSFANGMPNPEELYKIDPEYATQFEQNQITSQVNTRNFLKGAATDLYARASRISDPAQQQAVINQYVKPLEPQLRKMGFPMNEPITLDHLKMILGTTPEEQTQTGIDAKVAEKRALFPMDLQLAQARAEAMRPLVNYQTIERPEGTYRLNPQTGESELVSGIPGKKSAEEKPLTESQAKNAGFASRLFEANNNFNEVANKISPEKLAVAGATAETPLISQVTNSSLSPEEGLAIQAKRQFINSILRPESGASIAPSEFKSADIQYFPQVGDDEKRIAQKAQARETAIKGMLIGIPEKYHPMPKSEGNIHINIENPEDLSSEDRKKLSEDIEKSKSKPTGKIKFLGFD